MAAQEPETPLVEREEGRFVVRRRGVEAELVYDRTDEGLVLVHTGVPDALGGHGVGGALVQAAVGWAAELGVAVVPWCPFARRWLREHPDEAATVTIDWRSQPPS